MGPGPQVLQDMELSAFMLTAIPIYWDCNGVLRYSDLLGLGVLGYSDLLGVGVPMSGKVSAMCRLAAAHCTSIFCSNRLGIDDRAPMIGHR